MREILPVQGEYRVEVTTLQPGNIHGHKVQVYNCSTLDRMWVTVTAWRGKPGTVRIRVYTLLATFEMD